MNARSTNGSTALQSQPLNCDIPRLFIAATRQNDGKTTTSLGLFAALRQRFDRVGYIKPIGQRFIDVEGLMIDEDSFLLNSIYDVEVPIEAMSPVAIDTTFTRRFLDDPEKTRPVLVDKIVRAFDRTAYQKDAVIIEGSGHAGVGAICDLSNAQVAKLLGAKAVIVSRGGIGKPVDEIALNLALFEKYNVEVIGVIINKVLPDKYDVIETYTRKALERIGIPLLGVLPEMNELAAPNLGQVVEETNGRWLNARQIGVNARINKVIVGAMTARGVIDNLHAGTLIIVPGDRDDVLLATLASLAMDDSPRIAGLVLTRNLLPHPKLMEMLAHTDIPIVICREESYAVASKIHSMTVKTQPHDLDKIPLIKDLIMRHVDLDRLLPKL
ncbi:MAG: AAA family ATPase [Opitutales bacterium]|nr:AAA family ATPase [Opitutales bacterium]